MSRPCLTGSITAVCVLAMSASLAFAQSQWKEIPVGYNMPAMAMAATPAGAMPAPFPKAASKSSYRGQGRDPKPSWEVEIHGGGFFNTSQDDGTPGAFPAATPFTTFSGDSSLAVSSYMFGPGAQLTNDFASGVGGISGVKSLDPIALSQISKRDNGAAIGFRISRDLTSRFNLEFSGDYSSSAVAISDKAFLGAIDTLNSFGTFFSGVGPSGANHIDLVGETKRSAGAQIFWTGVVNVNLKTSGKNIPYLTFGGGGVSNVGPSPHMALLGYYDFDGAAGPHAETDLVNLRSVGSRTEWVGVLGIGYKYYATSHWGIRFDLRDHITPYRLDTFLDATPHVAALAPPDIFEGNPGTSPGLQFSTDPTAQSTLSGPAIVGLRTFKGSGWFNQINASGGIFYRF